MDSINIKELKDITTYIIGNNKQLREKNKKTTALEVIGESGIGKTSVIIQLAEALKMDCIKLNLTQLEELGDLIGYPVKEYNVKRTVYGDATHMNGDRTEFLWVPHDLLHTYLSSGWELASSASRMGYAPPTWLPKTTNPNGGLLILDDYNRADPRFIQATMELIDRGQYISWSLPPNWTICLTSNPDNGDYNVSSLDNAQKTRYVSFNLEFDKDIWAQWAESEEIDGRCINFVLAYPELLSKQEGVQKINPRSLVTFFNTISGFKDFSERETLATILNISKGCFTSKENVVGNLFTMFIANKLDKLISPEDMLTAKWEVVKRKVKDCIYDGTNYRADIAAVLTTRLMNYTIHSFDKGASSESFLERIIEFVECDERLLSEDLIFHLIKSLVSKYPSRTNKLMLNSKIISKII